MTRQLRAKSSTGIYHVMLRGINRQIIFEQPADYRLFISLLEGLTSPKNESGNPLPPRCRLYAYCLMPNQIQLIVKEEGEQLSTVVKLIAASYALYYNKKYERCGHLFQDRFKSEPVNDAAYFTTLLRYVHQNPVAGGLCQRVEDYPWSSWGEFVNKCGVYRSVCSVAAVLKWMPLEELQELVNDPLPKTTQVLDYDRRKGGLSDEEVSAFLCDTYGLRSPTDLQLYTKEHRNIILQAAKDCGASIKQLSRLTGFGEKIIRNA